MALSAQKIHWPLNDLIAKNTGIDQRVLFDYSKIKKFPFDERLKWMMSRKTTRIEDSAYCLLGICEVFLPLIYGEGQEHAMVRLREEIQKRHVGRGVEHVQISPGMWNDRQSLVSWPSMRDSMFSFLDPKHLMKTLVS